MTNTEQRLVSELSKKLRLIVVGGEAARPGTSSPDFRVGGIILN